MRKFKRSVTNNNCSVSLILRTDKEKKNGKCPINYFVNINGVRRKVPLKKKEIEKKYWLGNRSSNYIKKTYPNYIIFNKQLSDLMFDVENYILAMENNNEVITHSKIKKFLLNIDEDRITFFEFYERYIERVEKKLKDNTIRDYKSSLRVLKEFVKYKKYSNELYLEDITQLFVEEYEEYLLYIRKNKPNSLYNRHKNLRAILNRALKEKRIDEHPYQDFTVVKGDKVDKAITITERERIRKLPIENEKLDIVRDIFVFCCYTGLRYGDAINLKWGDIKVFEKFHSSGVNLYIEHVQEKVVAPVFIPILDVPQRILLKYYAKLNKIENRDKDKFFITKIFPHVLNQTMNRRLKKIAVMADININLTTHCGRHTFASALSTKGVDVATVSVLMGHSSSHKTTTGYIDYSKYDPKPLIPEIIKISSINRKRYKDAKELKLLKKLRKMKRMDV